MCPTRTISPVAKVHAAPPVGKGKSTLKFSVKHTSQRPRHGALKLINGPMLFFVGSPRLKQAELCEENKDDGNVGFAIATLVFAVALAPCLIRWMTTVQREGKLLAHLSVLSRLCWGPKEKATSHVTKALRSAWVSSPLCPPPKILGASVGEFKLPNNCARLFGMTILCYSVEWHSSRPIMTFLAVSRIN